MGQKDYTCLIEEYFEGHWVGDEFQTYSPFREDKNIGGGFIIEKSGNYLDRLLKKAGSINELLKLQLGDEYDPKILRGKLIKRTDYIYRHSKEEEAFRVARMQYAFSKKFLPFRMVDGKEEWTIGPYSKKGGGKLRPLYNQENLVPGPVVIVEGEKCVDALKPIYPNVVTWSFGATKGSQRLTDWEPLKTRELIIWPDNDDAGKKAVRFIQQYFYGHKLRLVNTVSLGYKEDVADLIERGDDPLPYIEKYTTLIDALPWEARKMGMDDWFQPDCYETDKGVFKIKSTYNNFKAMMGFYKCLIKVNKRKMRYEAEINGEHVPFQQVDAKVLDIAVRNDFNKGNLTEYINLMAEENAYYPVRDWLDELPCWDGDDHISKVFGMLTIEQPRNIYPVLFKRWMISAVACNYEEPFRSRGVLVLQGGQSIGKTTFFRNLFPNHANWFVEGLALDPRQKDDIEQALSYWSGELGELEGVFKRTDIARLKSFLSSEGDTFRQAYAKRPEFYPRKTVFCGSVNQEEFLPDKTGNTRFWVIPVKDIDYEGSFDMQQLWAQAKDLYTSGEQWWLTRTEEQALNERNKDFENRSPVVEKFYNCFELDGSGNPIQDTESTAPGWSVTDILQRMGFDKPSYMDRRDLNGLLKSLNLATRTTKSKNKGYVPLKIEEEF